MARVSRRNGRTHQRFAMSLSIAKTGSRSSSDRARPASRKLTWLSARMAFGPAVGEIVGAAHLEPVEGAEDDRQKVAERAGRQGPEDQHGRDQVAAANDHEERRRMQAEPPAAARRARAPATMKAALSTLTAAMVRARRASSLQAWTAVKAGTMKRPPDSARPKKSIAMRSVAPPLEELADRQRRRGRARSRSHAAEVEREDAHQHGGDGRRQQDDAAVGQPGGEARAQRDADREDREQQGDHLLVAAEHVLDQRRAAATAPRRRPARTSSHRCRSATGACRRRGRAAARRSSGRCWPRSAGPAPPAPVGGSAGSTPSTAPQSR